VYIHHPATHDLTVASGKGRSGARHSGELQTKLTMWLGVTRHRLGALLGLVVVIFCPGPARAHDASVWGGLFRTRDAGATWVGLNPGSFVSGALALAVSPVNPHHLLLATDTGVSRSRNGGRDWTLEAPDVLGGPAFAAAFDVDGQRALITARLALFAHEDGRWSAVRAPAGSLPARILVARPVRGSVYLAGQRGLYRSDDWGQSWLDVGRALPAPTSVRAVVVSRTDAQSVYVVADGRCWVSADAGRHWDSRGEGAPEGRMEALVPDPGDANRLWSVADGQVLRSDDEGRRWRPIGQRVPEAPLRAHALVVADQVLVLATDRGVYRSPDGGARWMLASDSLPAHLDAGMLTRDPADRDTFYAGFAVTPSDALAERELEAAGMLAQLTPDKLAKALPFLTLVLLAAVAGAWRLATYVAASRSAPR